MSQLPPLSLYIHIPWCVQKCPYCDFNSHGQKSELPEQAYVNRLVDDLTADLEWVQGRPIHTIFIGGGTPSLFSAAAIAGLITRIRERVHLTDDCEITMEANPGTFEVERFAGFVAAGITRLSLGVQSLQNEQLTALGRIHDSAQAITATNYAKQLLLQSYNVDLMHGLPGQSVELALEDLRQIIALDPPHISWYQLTIEPNTQFASRPPTLPDDDVLWDIYQRGHALLEAAGYQQYEVSAYAKAGHQARHNRNYWTFGDYLGIGCGAHSKITQKDAANGTLTLTRCEKIKHPQGYLDITKPLRYRQWQVPLEERLFEYFMNRLRLHEPIPHAEFEARTGLATAAAEQALSRAYAQGLVTANAQSWETTPTGRQFLNSILDELV